MRQFFEGENERLSMPRLCMFLSFWPATYVMLATMNENIFGWYLSAYAAAYGVASVSGALSRGKKNAKLGIE